jgi:hypothetical protein
MPFKDIEQKREYQRKYNSIHKIKNKRNVCKYCNTPITQENKYSFTVCNSCIRIHLGVCEDDCFNCEYDDCKVSKPAKLRDISDAIQYRVKRAS